MPSVGMKMMVATEASERLQFPHGDVAEGLLGTRDAPCGDRWGRRGHARGWGYWLRCIGRIPQRTASSRRWMPVAVIITATAGLGIGADSVLEYRVPAGARVERIYASADGRRSAVVIRNRKSCTLQVLDEGRS